MGATDVGWWQFRVVATAGQAEWMEAQLFASGALSITLLDAEDQPILEPAPGETPLWDHVVLVALYAGDQSAIDLANTLSNALSRAVEPSQLEQLEDRAWERSWMAHFEPMHFGGSLWIVPSFAEAPDPSGVNVKLDPGLAFGTGTHPTTALCLRHLSEYPPVGQRVIDYGCGSGVLAVAAVMLGAECAWATDLDDQALVASADNAANNNVADRLHLSRPEQPPEWKADVLLANILHGPLIALRDTLVGSVCPGGMLVLSGVLAEQSNALREHYQPALINIEIEQQGDWCRLRGRVA